MSVYAKKTKTTRIVPIDPRLYPLLSEAFENAKARQKRVVTLSTNNRHKNFKVILKRASIAPWKDLFQTLRRSCETEWAMKHPQHAVSEWTGHSMAVSKQFYLQVTDDHYDAASEPPEGDLKSAAESDAAAAEHAMQDPANGKLWSVGRSLQETHKPAPCNNLQHNAGSCSNTPYRSRTCNLRIRSPELQDGVTDCLPINYGEFQLAEMGQVAQNAAHCDAELQIVAQAWPMLDEIDRGRILAIVREASERVDVGN